MSILSRLFGGGGAPEPRPEAGPEPVEHDGFRIFAEPVRDGAGWRVGARIETEVDGEVKVHRMIRADTIENEDTARDASLRKARMLIDQQGMRIFDS
ncbi:HlyU family transcriptional regulator [Rhodosalinus sp. K401]|uniref:HlyU family transcriptional regulator n=1 Tax=Rhodosalinus sp. K401 TaxID=3239195 RepID=UPI0035266AAB